MHMNTYTYNSTYTILPRIPSPDKSMTPPQIKECLQNIGAFGVEARRLNEQSNLGHVTCPLVECQVQKVTKGLFSAHQSPSQAVLIHTLSISVRGMGRRPHSSCGHSRKGRAGCLVHLSILGPALFACPYTLPLKLCRHPYSICLYS